MDSSQFEQKWQAAKLPANVQETSEGFLLRNNEDLKKQGNIIGRLISILFIIIFSKCCFSTRPSPI